MGFLIMEMHSSFLPFHFPIKIKTLSSCKEDSLHLYIQLITVLINKIIMENKLKIQIWSDIMCPYCYIGKRRVEGALAQFEHKDAVEIEWKSFQLDASFVASEDDDMVEHLATKYKKDKQWAQEMMDSMTENAKNSGLDFHFEKAVMANSFNAHRLLHLAKKHNLSDELEELLFKAYLTEGKNINDLLTLSKLGLEAGLEFKAIEAVLQSDAYAKDVKDDIIEAQSIGVQGVPFFVFDNKYAVSGAQQVETFVKTLEKVWEEGKFTSKPTILNTTDGNNCGIDGCD
jgi:predicted DsbA family dithiol-disulfide isomerase